MRPLGFRARLLWAALTPSLLLTGVLSYLWLSGSQAILEDALQKRIDAVASQLASAAEISLFAGDDAALNVLVKSALESDSEVVSASVLDLQGKVWARSARPALAMADPDLSVSVSGAPTDIRRVVKAIRQTPLMGADPFMEIGADASTPVEGRLLGHVVLEISLDNQLKELKHLVLLGVLSIALSLLLAGALVIYLAGGVTGPIGRIVTVVKEIGNGNLSARLRLDPGSVLYPLEQGLNWMADKVAGNQEELHARIKAATEKLQLQKQIAEQEARLDPLTGLYNRRAFMEKAALELHRAERYDSPLSLILVDLDHFKRINDSQGHDVGDQVLLALALVMAQSVRDIDIVARLGGEEFVILMPDTDLAKAELAAERMRLAIAAMQIDGYPEIVDCTASLGVTECRRGEHDIQDMLVQADHAMYEAKESGRNRVCAFRHEQ